MNRQLPSMDATTITDRYISLATRHGDATENGNSDEANSAYHELDALFAKIIRLGIRENLVPLLKHKIPAVRAKAAIHTYVLDPQRSGAVLESVAAGAGLVGFSAKMTLKQLKAGGLEPK